MNGVRHGLLGVADAGAFLARLTRLDRAALVRLRPAVRSEPGAVPGPEPEAGPPDDAAHTALWGRLPWQVLVTRCVRGRGPDEATVAAADLLAVLAGEGERLPARRDADWRWPLPSQHGRVVERVAVRELVRIARAAAGTLRSVTAAHRIGERAVRDALLDHVPIVVTGGVAGADPVEVPQRLVQAVVQMGFLGPVASPPGPAGSLPPGPAAEVDQGWVQVRIAGSWTGLAAPYGTAWLQTVNEFSIRPLSVHPNG